MTCSGCSVLARLSAAIWPSGSSPCTPPITSTVGPAPLPTETIGIQRFDQPAVFDERGTFSIPVCFPSAVGSMVQETGESLMPAGDSSGLLTISL